MTYLGAFWISDKYNRFYYDEENNAFYTMEALTEEYKLADVRNLTVRAFVGGRDFVPRPNWVFESEHFGFNFFGLIKDGTSMKALFKDINGHLHILLNDNMVQCQKWGIGYYQYDYSLFKEKDIVKAIG